MLRVVDQHGVARNRQLRPKAEEVVPVEGNRHVEDAAGRVDGPGRHVQPE